MTEPAKCELCGEPMPEGEEMFNYHGLSGPCPKPQAKPSADREGEIRQRVARVPDRPSLTYRNDVEFLLKEIERLRAEVAPSRSPAEENERNMQQTSSESDCEPVPQRTLETAEAMLAENGLIWEEGKGYVFDGKD